MARSSPRPRISAIVLALVTLPGTASAQALFEQFSFQFSFSTPGARSKAMAQAYTAVADDASAAETNPAGLAFRQATNELMLELSSVRNTTERAARADAFETGRFSNFGDRVTAPSYVGWVLRPRVLGARGLSVTAFYHRFLTYRESFHLDRRAVPTTNVFFLPTDGNTDLSGNSLGLGLGWRVNPRLAFGLSGKMVGMHMRTFTTRSDIFDPTLVVNIQQIDDEDWSPAFTVGGVLAPIRGRPGLRLGVSYSYNPAFALRETFDAVNGGQRVAVNGYPRTIDLHVPDRLSFGLARAGVRLTAAMDLAFQRYSELAGDTSTLLPQVGDISRSVFTVRNTWSVHAGVEWKLMEARNTYLRAGVLTAPTHAYRYSGDASSPGRVALGYAFNSLPETTDVGWAVGLGQNFPWTGAAKVKATVAWTKTPGQSSEALISLSLFH
jgi:hypothetical protein